MEKVATQKIFFFSESLLASINRKNVKFFHNSAKSGEHVVPDSLSRLKDTTCKSKDCAVERFLDDILLISTLFREL